MNKDRWGEIVRFGLVGTTAVAIQYLVYLLLCPAVTPVLANTLAYIVSFVFNYLASTRYTFKVRKSLRNGVGFILCHVANYLLQSGLLVMFVCLGMAKQFAMIPVFAICVPTNFVLVRLALKGRRRK